MIQSKARPYQSRVLIDDLCPCGNHLCPLPLLLSKAPLSDSIVSEHQGYIAPSFQSSDKSLIEELDRIRERVSATVALDMESWEVKSTPTGLELLISASPDPTTVAKKN